MLITQLLSSHVFTIAYSGNVNHITLNVIQYLMAFLQLNNENTYIKSIYKHNVLEKSSWADTVYLTFDNHTLVWRGKKGTKASNPPFRYHKARNTRNLIMSRSHKYVYLNERTFPINVAIYYEIIYMFIMRKTQISFYLKEI